MKQIVQSARSGKLQIKEVPAPRPGRGEVLVQTRASLISAGTDRMMVAFAKKSLLGKAKARPDLVKKTIVKARTDGLQATLQAVMTRLDEPLPLGYSAAGIILEVGEGLEGHFHVGQRVAVAGAGLANHAEINAVPRNLTAPVPEAVSDEEACFATLAAIALHAVRNTETGLGDIVAVIGAGLVGQLAAQFLRLAGTRVAVIDYDSARLGLARDCGAEWCFDPGDGVLADRVMAATGGRGCDAIIMAAATDSSEPFDMAAAIARDRAKVSVVGMSGTAFPYAEFMKKELSLVVSRSYGPGRYDNDYEDRDVTYPPGFVRWTETGNLSESLRLMSAPVGRRLDVTPLITHRFEIDAAEAAYELVGAGGDGQLGVVLTYPEAVAKPQPAPAAQVRLSPTGCTLGMVGAGNYARTTLLPLLKNNPKINRHSLVTRRGATAEHAGNQFGFQHVGTDVSAILDNPEINTVVIATRHDSHAELVAHALRAGKSVYVEKPLGLTAADINLVEDAATASKGILQVGFNRRFSPLVVEAKARLASLAGTSYQLFRINAGPLPTDSWIHGPEGGGRILSEVCHFVDLAQYFAGQKIESVQADAAATIDAASCGDVTVTLRFTDGSMATIAYTGLGDAGYPKEQIEIFSAGTVVAIDNFRRMTITADGRETASSGRGQDKGHAAAIGAFIDAVVSGGPAPVDHATHIDVSRATLAVLESLQSGARVTL